MKQRKNRNLHVVRESEDPTDKRAGRLYGQAEVEVTEREIRAELIRQSRKRQQRIAIVCIIIVIVSVMTYLLVSLQTYTKVRVSDTYPRKGASDNSYVQFLDGVIKYSKDGIAYMDQTGKEVWNQSYQIKNPMLDVNNKSVAVADKDGNDILIFQEEGLKGEVHTTMPVERISVSEQGIVSAILKNESAMKIMCYDIKGNVLVEHKTTLAGTGYPIDIALSADGNLMQVLYLYTQKGQIVSRLHYYNFGDAGEGKTDHQVTAENYKDTILASGFFMNAETSAAVGDNRVVIYEGKDTPEQVANIKLDKEIKNVFHSEKYVGLILKNQGKSGYELRLYDKSGKVVLSKDFKGDYKHVKICNNQVIMYDGKNCNIYMKNGIQKFKGETDSNILEIFPVEGVNRYIIMSANGMEKVRLVK
mgnify:FL=1